MKETFEITQTSRKLLSRWIENLSLEQLNTIPQGFNNNIIWNIGHIIVVQQMLVYNLSGLPMHVEADLVSKYKKGTRPTAPVTEAEVALLKELLFTTVTQTESDFGTGLFENFTEYTVMTGFVIKNASDAIAFNYYHEALHTGVIMSLKKLV
jgi:hypothetical protein